MCLGGGGRVGGLGGGYFVEWCLVESYLDRGCMGRGCMGIWVVGCLGGGVWVEVSG